MRLSLVFALIVGGLLMLPLSIWLGAGLCCAGFLLHRTVTVGMEQAFISGLMVLGGAGALAVFAQFAYQTLFTAPP